MNNILNTINQQVVQYNANLIAVSKLKPNDAILEMYELGQRRFGENYVQELAEKAATLPIDIEWHLIGHLQSNKVKYVAPFVAMIHTVDSLSLLQEINKQAAKHERVISVLLQFKINDEATKFGLYIQEAFEILNHETFSQLKNIRIEGVMGMATFTENKAQVRHEFQALKSIFTNLKNQRFVDDLNFKHISMGMSDDYDMALEEGSTMIRIGSLLFGKR